jgi:hypothetical protein
VVGLDLGISQLHDAAEDRKRAGQGGRGRGAQQAASRGALRACCNLAAVPEAVAPLTEQPRAAASGRACLPKPLTSRGRSCPARPCPSCCGRS